MVKERKKENAKSKMQYLTPEMEIWVFGEDIVRCSGEPGGTTYPDPNPDPWEE